MAKHKYDYLFKILIIGESGVDKTPFLLRFTNDTFIPGHITSVGKSYTFYHLYFVTYRY